MVTPTAGSKGVNRYSTGLDAGPSTFPFSQNFQMLSELAGMVSPF